MKKIDISQTLMHSVTNFESKRSLRTLAGYGLILGLFCIGIIFICYGIFRQLSDQDSFVILSIFSQDWEIISLFWKDSLSVFLEELPKLLVILSIFSGMSILIIGIVKGNAIIRAGRRLKNISDMRFQKSKITSLSLAILLGITIAGVFAAIIYQVYTGKLTGSNPRRLAPTDVTGTPNVSDPTVDLMKPETAEPPVSQGLVLRISTPQDQTTVTTSSLVVNGTTSPLAEVFVNDKTVNANSKGNFSVPLILDEGENLISVSSNDADGNFASQEFVVTYTPAN